MRKVETRRKRERENDTTYSLVNWLPDRITSIFRSLAFQHSTEPHSMERSAINDIHDPHYSCQNV